MNFIDKLGSGISSAVDMVVEKNRQLAQLNRLSAIIKNENEILNLAYVSLGKNYYKILEEGAEPADVENIISVIKNSENRLKKAQARYDYIKNFGIPKSSYNEEIVEQKNSEEETEPVQAAETNETEETFDDDADITIAYADGGISSNEDESKIKDEIKEEFAETAQELTEKAAEKLEDAENAVETAIDKTVEKVQDIEKKAAETVNELRKKRAGNKNKPDTTEEIVSDESE